MIVSDTILDEVHARGFATMVGLVDTAESDDYPETLAGVQARYPAMDMARYTPGDA